MPLAELLPRTARTFRNMLLGKHEMTFDVIMWSESAQEAVLQQLTEEGRIGQNGLGK